ncbi:uncharacterized protein CDAR_170781 [Caerostris darwini]|uniref:Ribosomal protein S2 n=1 Tax=Caerostris darwini TaxID=1538125 RepID=A0AAV4SGV8_9ARAC|nr:uncharacterized protein CDAR_170781 [Caerostris darwini]
MENNKPPKVFINPRPPSLEEDVMLSYKKFDIKVIDDNPNYSSKAQLNDALRGEKSVIVIRDKKLGNDTIMWLTLGQCIQHLTLATAMGAVLCSSGINEPLTRIGKPLALSSLALNLGYHAFWNPQPLNNYRIAQGPSIPSMIKNEPHPNTVIVRKVVPCSSNLHSFASIMALMAAFWKDIKSFNPKETFEKVFNKAKEETK